MKRNLVIDKYGFSIILEEYVPKSVDITGSAFYRLTGVKRVGTSNGGKAIWLFKCICGNSHTAVVGDVISGRTKSCGCLKSENSSRIGKENKIHGKTKSKEANSWRAMMRRCYKQDSHAYHLYGGSGVTVDQELQTLVGFLEYMGSQPNDGKKYSIDRIDNSKGYEIGNIRWATTKEQARNKKILKKNNTGVTGVCWAVSNGITYALASWVEDGKPRTKRFSSRDLGLLPAFSLACQLRKEKIKELNEKGYGYTENHGK